MSIRTVLVAILALICGGSAAFVVMSFLSQQSANAQPETAPVVVAAVDIGRAAIVTKDMVTIKQWPKSHVPPGVLTKIEEIVDKTTQVSLVKDEPVFASKLAKGRGLQALVPPGMRAYTINTPSVSAGVGGFIQPDDRVDVLLTMTTSEQQQRDTGGGIATVLLQYIQVLAAGPSLVATDEKKVEGRTLNSVTLLVTPRQVQELTLAQTKGSLNLSLRRDGDSEDPLAEPLYLADLPFLRERPNVVEPEPAQAKPDPEPVREPEPAPLPPPPPPPPRKVVRTIPPIHIRTLRGNATGLVVIQPGSTIVEEVDSRSAADSSEDAKNGGWSFLKSLFESS